MKNELELAVNSNLEFRTDTSNIMDKDLNYKIGEPVNCLHYWNYNNHDAYHDAGKKAYDIIKTLREKKLIKINTVDDFCKVMDTLIMIL